MRGVFRSVGVVVLECVVAVHQVTPLTTTRPAATPAITVRREIFCLGLSGEDDESSGEAATVGGSACAAGVSRSLGVCMTGGASNVCGRGGEGRWRTVSSTAGSAG